MPQQEPEILLVPADEPNGQPFTMRLSTFQAAQAKGALKTPATPADAGKPAPAPTAPPAAPPKPISPGLTPNPNARLGPIERGAQYMTDTADTWAPLASLLFDPSGRLGAPLTLGAVKTYQQYQQGLADAVKAGSQTPEVDAMKAIRPTENLSAMGREFGANYLIGAGFGKIGNLPITQKMVGRGMEAAGELGGVLLPDIFSRGGARIVGNIGRYLGRDTATAAAPEAAEKATGITAQTFGGKTGQEAVDWLRSQEKLLPKGDEIRAEIKAVRQKLEAAIEDQLPKWQQRATRLKAQIQWQTPEEIAKAAAAAQQALQQAKTAARQKYIPWAVGAKDLFLGGLHDLLYPPDPNAPPRKTP